MKKTLTAIALSIAAAAAQAQAPGERTAWQNNPCDHECLSQFARDYVAAMVRHDASKLKAQARVRFTENDVELPFGKEGMWATATGVAPTALIVADVQSGQAAWIGTAEENGKPVYFALRLAVHDGAIAEAETVVVRNGGLPLPFADVTKVVHDPTFNEILPVEQRRSRERLRAVADSYFNTVELNDGTVFAPFDPECGRLENGILTTAAGAGSAGAISPGCEAQFKLGIYRINKRVRERRYPVIDVERGIVVATGFFDHANEFNRYKLNDGREMKTALNWPNSISLIEAFRVRDGKIHRIEAIFTYVPYFMHNPFYAYPPAAAPAAEDPAAAGEKCDGNCLQQLADRFMTAMAAQKPQDIAWANHVRFTENDVGQQVGEGIWGSIRDRSKDALIVADASTGTVAWYGLIYDHESPAWAGVRLKVHGARVAEVEVIVERERNPGPWGDPKQFRVNPDFGQVLPAPQRMKRAAMVKLVEGYADTVQQNDGRLHTSFAPSCTRTENGVVVSQGAVGSAVIVKSPGLLAQGCEAQLKLGVYHPVDQVRARRVLAVDEQRGLVVMASYADFGLAQRQYRLADGHQVETQDFHPSARELFEVYKLSGGKIQAVEAVSVFQPYRMPSAWSN